MILKALGGVDSLLLLDIWGPGSRYTTTPREWCKMFISPEHLEKGDFLFLLGEISSKNWENWGGQRSLWLEGV